jgi:hypothetical protein
MGAGARRRRLLAHLGWFLLACSCCLHLQRKVPCANIPALYGCRSGLHGNPHSEAGWGECRGGAAEAARLATLRMCGADPELYNCIFTAGATGGWVFLCLRDAAQSCCLPACC